MVSNRQSCDRHGVPFLFAPSSGETPEGQGDTKEDSREGSFSAAAEEKEEAARAAALEKDERRRRFIEVKMAREKAQLHLETLKSKKNKREEEVRRGWSLHSVFV